MRTTLVCLAWYTNAALWLGACHRTDAPAGASSTSNQDIAATTAARPIAARPPNTTHIVTPDAVAGSKPTYASSSATALSGAGAGAGAGTSGGSAGTQTGELPNNGGSGSAVPITPPQQIPYGAPENADPTSNDPCNRVPACYSALQRDLCDSGRGDCLADLESPAVGDDLNACKAALTASRTTASPYMLNKVGYKLPPECQ